MTTPVSTNLVAAVADIADTIRDAGKEARALGRLPDSAIASLTAAGIMTMTCPHEHGGAQLSMTEQYDVLVTLGELDGSVAWVAAINAAMPPMIAAFGAKAFDEFLAGPPQAGGVFSMGGSATPVGGGFQVSGAWPFVSHQHHSAWVVVPALADGGVPMAFLVPRSAFSVAGPWEMSGLQGTGSNPLSLNMAFVPSHRAVSLQAVLDGTGAEAGADFGNYYRQPMSPIICGLSVGPAVGMARSALALFVEHSKKRGITYSSHEVQADAPITHIRVNEARRKIREADLYGRAIAATIDRHVGTGEPWDADTRAQCREDAAVAVRRAAEAAEILIRAAGAGARADGHPLLAVVNDIATLANHSYLNPDTTGEDDGRAAVGLERTSIFY